MIRRPTLRACVFGALLCCGGAVPLAVAVQGGPAPKRLALLVGCTRYPDAPFSDLQGPVNDVKLFGSLLAKHGFKPADVHTLAGWPADAKQRPTAANIAAGFEQLIADATDQSQVVILLSGHGSQIPIPAGQDPLDPKNFEPDGMDEIFLAADFKLDKDGKPANYVIDDKIGAWLDRLRAKGAAVWIIFDCCHSGSMDRGPVAGDAEVFREVKAEQLTPQKQIDDAINRAAKAVAKAKAEGKTIAGELLRSGMAEQESGKAKKKGSLVAFYGAQSYERAPELVRPAEAPRAPENMYGMLTYTINQVLSQQQHALSYRELGQALAAHYLAERGARAPTPYCEGDLDREVLGTAKWDRAKIVLGKEGSKLEVNAGGLLGLTPGTVLAVHPPAGDKRDPKTVIGYVQVGAVKTTSARVAPCAHDKTPAIAAGKLPVGGWCEVVSRDFGDMKLRLAIGAPDDKALRELLAELGGKLDKETLDMVRIVKDQAEAEWILWSKAGEIQLRQGEGRTLSGKDAPPSTFAKAGLPTGGRVFAVCPAALPAKDILPRLQGDLQRLFSWQNIWRIAGTMGNGMGGGSDLGLKFEVVKIGSDGKAQGPLTNGTPLLPGQELKLRLTNDGVYDLGVTLLVLGSDGEIAPKAFAMASKAKPIEMEGAVNDKSLGKEGFVILATPLLGGKAAPDYSFLAQGALKEGVRAVPRLERGPETPFGALLRTASAGKGTRSFDFKAPANPALLTASWITVAEPQVKAE